jgi:hypothetical protein
MLPLLMLLACVVLRIVPHPWNFAPVGATSVFVGRTLPVRIGVPVLFAAMLLGDIALARLKGYPLFTAATPFVYAGFAVQLLLGRWLRARRGGAIGAAVLGSMAFFTLSNFGVWVGGLYGFTLGGLAACYWAAIPFFGGTLAGDVLWTIVLSLVFRWIARRIPQPRQSWTPVSVQQIAPI